jgi:hypothetical protein
VYWNALWLRRIVVTSQKRIPCLGKSGMPRIESNTTCFFSASLISEAMMKEKQDEQEARPRMDSVRSSRAGPKPCFEAEPLRARWQCAEPLSLACEEVSAPHQSSQHRQAAGRRDGPRSPY